MPSADFCAAMTALAVPLSPGSPDTTQTSRGKTDCNQLHGFRLEYGIEAPKGVGALRRRLAEVLEDADNELCVEARVLLWNLGEELRRLDKRVKEFDTQVERISRENPACQRLETIPGIGPLTSTALVAAVGDAAEFRNGRELAA